MMEFENADEPLIDELTEQIFIHYMKNSLY